MMKETNQNNMNRNNMDRKQMMHWIMMLGFCATDMGLYLDTHPTDIDALEYMKQCVELYENAKKSYEAAYGPLCFTSAGRNGYWDWNEGPMPWEGVC